MTAKWEPENVNEKEFLENLTIVVDSREQLPYTFPGHRTVVEKLDVGDYSLLHCPEIAIERKSLDDLIGSLTSGRERFEAEMRRGAHYRYYKNMRGCYIRKFKFCPNPIVELPGREKALSKN